MYDNLLEQYKKLNKEEMRALLIYKSCLYKLINLVTSIENFLELDDAFIVSLLQNTNIFIDCSKFGLEINKPENLLLKYSIFSKVNFNDPMSLVKLSKDVFNILHEASLKMKTSGKVVVYRGISLNDDDCEEQISRGNLISSSIDKDQAVMFLSNDLSKKNILYEIEVDSDVPALVMPYSIVNEYESEFDMAINNIKQICLRKTSHSRQREILLFKDKLEFDCYNVKEDVIDGKSCEVKSIKATLKKNNLRK